VIRLLPLILLLALACRPEPAPPAAPEPPAGEIPDYSECFAGMRQESRLVFGSGDTLDGLLRRAGIAADQRAEAEEALAGHWSLSRFRAGSALDLVQDGRGDLLCLHYPVDYFRDLCLWRERGRYRAGLFQAEMRGEPFLAKASLNGSFYEAFRDQGYSGDLATRVADLFSGTVDFFLDLRPGDRMEVLGERLHRGDRDEDRLRVLAAWLQVEDEEHEAYLLPDSLGRRRYFQADGGSLSRQFLKAPLEYTRISSGFNPRRLHPVLNYVRPHNGVDYAAPVGTPVVATADGRVIARGRQSQAGRYVKIRHSGGIETTYMHLSRFAGGSSKGSRVSKGQVIGYVGSSGLTTGPHLDYRMKVNGKYIDPRRFRSAPSTPLPEGERAAFDQALSRYEALRDSLGLLSPWAPPLASVSSQPSR